MTVDVQKVAALLGEPRVHTPQELRLAVERGLPLAAVERTARYLFGSMWAAYIFSHIVPRTTYLRRKKAKRRAKLTPEESQRTERLARLTTLAEQVFEGQATAREFLISEQPNLGGQRPVDLIGTDLGTREVEDLLYALEYSLPV